MILGLGERLRESRLRAGLSQEDVGKIIQKQSQSISVYETGNGLPSLPVFVKLATLYKVSADWLLGYENQKSIIVNDLSDDNIELLQRMADVMRKANSERQDG